MQCIANLFIIGDHPSSVNNIIYENAATAAADFIINHLTTEDGALLHCYRDRQSFIPVNLYDY